MNIKGAAREEAREIAKKELQDYIKSLGAKGIPLDIEADALPESKSQEQEEEQEKKGDER